MGPWYDSLDEKAMTAAVAIIDGGNVTIPVQWAVCPTCDGAGAHVNPSIDAGGISPEEFANDPDFEEAYRSGRYDVPCYECGGRRVVAVPIKAADRQAIARKREGDLEFEAMCRLEERTGA